MIISSDNARIRGTSKLTLNAVIKNDIIELYLDKHLTLDQAQ